MHLNALEKLDKGEYLKIALALGPGETILKGGGKTSEC